MPVRAATREDVPAILEIYNDAVLTTTATADEDPITLEARLAWFDDRVASGYPVLVYEDDGPAVAYAALGPWIPRKGYRYTAENSVYVAPEAQHRGIGRLLLGDLIQEARYLGLRNLVASIATENEPSIRLHKSFGYRQVGHMPELMYKFDRWIDVTLMQLRL